MKAVFTALDTPIGIRAISFGAALLVALALAAPLTSVAARILA